MSEEKEAKEILGTYCAYSYLHDMNHTPWWKLLWIKLVTEKKTIWSEGFNWTYYQYKGVTYITEFK